ncbi:inositol monophosphatase family protein [Streptomyces sp. DH12]|uniref:inositol monophosphatase family protein n=1 Tax=Streptomyces sp. DH12 TaxID=2857010 RepID=UPI001E43ED6E|nr:inositol monophosphatase family protein [Streptomyces sp. DH12]
MRILVLHQNLFERLAYERAIDHSVHDVVYAGTPQYLANIPPHVRCGTYALDPDRPVADQLRPWLAQQPPFQRIIARHEKLITPAAELRDAFGIPGMGAATARNFRDKVTMKRTLERAGFRVPRFVPADALAAPGGSAAPGGAGTPEGPTAPDGAAPGWRGRTIAKPRDEGGSQGVRLFETLDEALAFVRGTAAGPSARTADGAGADGGLATRYELEEYVEGPIWHVDGFLFKGEAVVAQASRYVGTPLRFENGSPIGSVQFDHPELTEWAVRCVRALGGETLTFHLEAIMTPDGPVFMEVAARCGGGYIVDVTERRTGAHLHTLDMASDVDDALADRFLAAPEPGLTYGFFLFPGHVHGGAAVSVRGALPLLDDPVVVRHRIAEPGRTTPTSHSYRPEHLPLSGVVRGPDPDALVRYVERVLEQVTVEDDHRLAHRLAEEAGELLLKVRAESGFADPAALKAAGDRLSHEFLAAALAAERPGDAVLSEEGKADAARLTAERVWIVDPLDGTREFSESGREDWAVHVALWAGGRLAAGAVALPARGVTLSTGTPPPPPDSPVDRLPVLGSRSRPPAFLAEVAGRIGAELVGMGSAGAKTAAVILGDARAYLHAGGQYEWDSAAPAAVALAAGLHVSRLDGTPPVYNRADPYLPDLLVCRPRDAAALLAAVAEATTGT